jgi:ferredoxin
LSEKLLVNPIECEGHGACAELLPEMITLDEWGYPIVDGRPLPPGFERDARAAVSACPTLALRLVRSLSNNQSSRTVRCASPGGTAGCSPFPGVAGTGAVPKARS